MTNGIDIFAGFEDEAATEPVTAPEKQDIFAGMEEPDSATESAKRNLTLVNGRNPQAEVKVRKDAEETGMPETFTRTNPDYNQTEQRKAIEAAPAGTTNLIAGDTTNAGIFQNHVKELGTIERLMTEDVGFGAALKAPIVGIAAGVAKTPEIVLDAYAIANEALKREPFDITTTFERGQILVDIRKALEKYKAENMFDLRKLSQEGQDFLRSKVGDTKLEELLFQAGETAGRMTGAAIVGGGNAILPFLSLGAGFGKTRTEVEAGSPKHRALIAGVMSAFTEYWTEKIPLDILLNKQGLTFMQRLLKGEVADVPGELVATATEMWAIDEKVLGKEAQPLEVYVQALIDTALVATFTTVGTTTGVAALEKASKKLDIDQNRSQKVVDRLKRIKEQMDESNIKQELGEQNMKVAIESMVGDEDAYITPEGTATLFQTDNPEQVKQASDIFLKLGIAPKEAMRQAQNGQDVIIKQADVLGLLTAEELDLISPHIKSDFADLSETQITEDVTADNKVILDESIAEVKEEELVFTSELDRIREQITKARTPEEAETVLPIIEGFANNLSLQGADRTAFLKSLEFKRMPFVKRVVKGAKRLFQAPTERDRALSDLIASLSVRRDQFIKRTQDVSAPEAQEFIKGLDERIAVARQELRDRVFLGFDTLFQARTGDPKAAVDFTDEKAIISLFEESDPSSVPHELGHTFLREMTAVEGVDGITDQFKSDMGAVREWLGAKEGEAYTTPQQEQFARGFELWLREGKAPNDQLDTIFARFKRWLTEVYHKATELNVELTPEIRGVFNRMIDADTETKTAAAVHNMIEPTTDRMNELGVPDAEQSDLKRLVRKGIDKAENALFRARNRAVENNAFKFMAESERELRAENRAYDVIDDILRNANEFISSDLLIMRREIAEGEAARRLQKRDPEGNIIEGEFIVTGGTFPEYFKGLGLNKKDTLTMIDKAVNGKRLTELQQRALSGLVKGYKEQTIRRAEEKGIEPPEFAGDLRFDRDEFVETYGEGAIDRLPNTSIMVFDGVSIDETALEYGYESGDIFIQELLNTLPLMDAIQNRVNQKNAELEATFKSEDYLAETQEYADFIQRWNDHLRNELTRATRADVTGKPRKKITTEQMKAYAQSQIDEMSVADAQRTDKFLNAMKRAAVNMRKAEKAKDYAKAIRESEKMLLNKEMAAISVRNKRAVTSFENRAKKFRKLGEPESVSYRYREGIRSLIKRFSILPNVAPQNEDYSVSDLKALLAPERKEKDDPYAVEFFASEFLIPKRLEDVRVRDYKKLSMLELKELDNAMKFLTKMGRDEQTGLLSDGETQLQEVVDENVEEMDAIKPQKVHDRFAISRKLTNTSRKFFANLLGLPYITKALGGYQALKGKLSSLEKWITERLKDIEDVRLRRYDEVRQRIQPHVNQITNAQRRLIKEHKGQKIFDSGVPVPEIIQDNGSQLNYWTPEQIVSMAFNRGNQSNINALLQGFQGLTLGQVDTLLNKYLTEQDMNAVQAILDEMETLFPETDRVHLKMKGFRMGKVPAQQWTFKGKQYRGGYYPLNYDRVLSDFIGDKKEIEDLFESEQAKFTVPFAAANHTLTRTESGHALPIDLRLIHIYKHFDKSIRYITHAETIRDVDRIIRNKEWRKAAEKALGKDVYKQIRPSLKHIANPHIPGVDIPGKRAIGYLRSVATAANLALNTMVAMKQVFSTPSAIHDMGLGDGGGFKAYLRGMGHVMASPSVSFNTMLDMSPYMKERITSWERDLLRPKFNRMTPAQREVAFGNRHVTWDDVVNLGFFEIKAMDTATVLPIWWGSYLDKLNENSSNEKEAIRHADNIVRDTQPSATALDVSAWFRSGGFFSLFNLHQTFTVGKYGQRQRTYWRAWQDKKITTREYAWFNFMDALIPLLSINVMVGFLQSGGLPGDDDEWKELAEKTISSWLFMGIPLVSSMYDAITKGWRDPLEVPGARQVKRTARTIGHMGQGVSNIVTGEELSGKEKEQLYWGMADMASDFSRVPVSKISKKALTGEGFREKIFGKKFKKRR